jgi:glycosyltransferase involved in cell wall biosynthesis
MSAARRRVLIEASKLADGPMDGIKRYVVELLRALADSPAAERLELEVMVLDRVYPIAALPALEPKPADGSPGASLHRLLAAIGALFPPLLLLPIRWLIPAPVARRFLGKEKAELQVPPLRRDARSLVALLLPPLALAAVARVLPERVRMLLWRRGILRPPPRAVSLEGYDLVHLTLPNHHHYLPPTRVPLLVTVHDLCHVACPEHQTLANRVTLADGLERAIEAGARFAAVSEATRLELIRACGLEPSRVVTVQSGCDLGRFRPVCGFEERDRVRRAYAIPAGRFLLTLCTLEPRKNLLGTLRAFELLIRERDEPGLALVIAGGGGWKSRELLRAAAREPRVHLAGYVEEEDLAALYSAATAFVYASHYEGFGFPLLEAMACGTPVVYGYNSSMPEIVGDAGLAANAGDPGDLARQLGRLLSDDDLAKALGRRAIERARRFSWERTASETLALYQRMLAEERPW